LDAPEIHHGAGVTTVFFVTIKEELTKS
jgi:hypothetical protein